jgi:hypothetical protein
LKIPHCDGVPTKIDDLDRPEPSKANIPTPAPTILDQISAEKTKVSERLAPSVSERATVAARLADLEKAERVLTRHKRPPARTPASAPNAATKAPVTAECSRGHCHPGRKPSAPSLGALTWSGLRQDPTENFIWRAPTARTISALAAQRHLCAGRIREREGAFGWISLSRASTAEKRLSVGFSILCGSWLNPASLLLGIDMRKLHDRCAMPLISASSQVDAYLCSTCRPERPPETNSRDPRLERDAIGCERPREASGSSPGRWLDKSLRYPVEVTFFMRLFRSPETRQWCRVEAPVGSLLGRRTWTPSAGCS